MSWFFPALCLYIFLKMGVWMVKSFDSHFRKPKTVAKKVRLSVVIPAHNEGPSIARTVKSVLAAGMKPEDIFILCNGCTDDTAEQVAACGVTPIIAPCSGKEETLTYAMKDLHLAAPSKYTHDCFFDADTEIDQEYFRVIKKRLTDDPTIDIICGRPKSLPHNYLTAHRAVQYWTFHKVYKSTQEKLSAILVVPGCAGVYSTETLRDIVWSPRTRIGDMDATIQAALQGKKIVFEPRAIVYTQDPSTLGDYTNQLYRRWNRGLWMNMRIHGILWKGPLSFLHWDCRLMFLDQFAPVLFLIGATAMGMHSALKLGLAFFVGLTLVEAIICGMAEKRFDIWKYCLIFPFLKAYDTFLFIASSPSILVKSEKSGVWASPKRY